jgi:hypothetical protein
MTTVKNDHRAQNAAPIGSLLRDSQVAECPDRPGEYSGCIAEAWKMFSAFGGMSLAIALRAAQHAAGRHDFEPVSVSATFCRPLECGPVRIATEVLARTASTAQVLARLHPEADARPHLVALANVGQRIEGAPMLQELSFPEGVLPVEDAITIPAHALAGFSLLRQSATRFAHDFWNRPGRASAGVHGADEPAEVCSWIRYHEPPLRADGSWDPCMYPAPADSMSPALFRGLGPNVPMFYPVTTSIDLHVFATARSEWILQRSRVVRMVDGYACGSIELWDEHRTLLALSTQRRFCKPLPPQGIPLPTEG